MEELVQGKFQLETSTNFDQFMNALGVSYWIRKLGSKSRPIVTISKDERDSYRMKSESLVKNHEMTFRLGREFEEMTPDGRKVRSTITMTDPTTMEHVMLGTNGGKDSKCIREFFEKKMVCTCTVEDIVTVREYKRI